MRVIRREFRKVSRRDVFTVVPIGDVHIGAAACDEGLLRRVVKCILADERTYWVGMGDYCEFVNIRDPRFDAATLADWVETAHLVDLGKAQAERFVEIVAPIADRCLALVEGNHERTIKQKTERDIYSEIVSGVKGRGGLASDQRLGLGIYGWLQLRFQRAVKGASRLITFNLHHGFVGGRLAGGKALNMQRWLWTHNADVVLFGHSHNTAIQKEAVEEIDRAGQVRTRTRVGAYTGTFLRTNVEGAATYSEAKGYFPLPLGGVRVDLRPGARRDADRIRLVCVG